MRLIFTVFKSIVALSHILYFNFQIDILKEDIFLTRLSFYLHIRRFFVILVYNIFNLSYSTGDRKLWREML